jgi:hypothetical protein
VGSLACLEDIARFCSFRNHEVLEELGVANSGRIAAVLEKIQQQLKKKRVCEIHEGLEVAAAR